MTRAEINRHISEQVGRWARGCSVYGTLAGENTGVEFTLTEIRRMARPGDTFYLNRFKHNPRTGEDRSYSDEQMDLHIPGDRREADGGVPMHRTSAG